MLSIHLARTAGAFVLSALLAGPLVTGYVSDPEHAREAPPANAEHQGPVSSEEEEASAETSEVAEMPPNTPADAAPTPDQGTSTQSPPGDEALQAETGLMLGRAVTAMPGVWSERPNHRLSGNDRYTTAAAVAQSTYPSSADTVILANGLDYPDALGAAALAAKLGAPLLLTEKDRVPTATSSEIGRLKPQRIILAGGPGVISAAVESSLGNRVKQMVRLGGGDRYATSAALSRYGWKTSNEVFVATGAGYADALAAAAGAGNLDAPVLLVPGMANSAPSVITGELSRLKPKTVHIAGGTGAVGSQMQHSLAEGRKTVRYDGGDRYETAANIAKNVFAPGIEATYWASGDDFPDALAGAASAGARGGALLLVRAACVPSVSYSANDLLVPTDTYLLGGAGVLSEGVFNGNECMIRPAETSASDWRMTEQLYEKVNAVRRSRGLAAVRVSDEAAGMPAAAWARSLGTGAAKQQPNLLTSQPWVRYQVVVKVGGTGNRADRAIALMQQKTEASRWLFQPNGGARAYVSFGYSTSGAHSNVVLYFGAGLNNG